MRRKLVVANWKMHGNLAENKHLLDAYRQKLAQTRHVDFAVCVPYPYLPQAQTELAGSNIAWGAQNLSKHEKGPHTGEVSVGMLKDFGTSYVIIGHSERREYHAESDEVVAGKVRAALKHGLVPVVCVGETAADLEEFGASAVPTGQLRAALQGLPASADIVVAYEPVWAIGSGQAATPQQAQEVCATLRSVVADVVGADAAARTRILYGGSVKAANIASFMREPDIDGALVGGASLVADEFAAIIRFEKHVGV